MLLTVTLPLNFLLLLLLNSATVTYTSTATNTTANLFEFAYPVVAFPVASVCQFPVTPVDRNICLSCTKMTPSETSRTFKTL
ncbi:hypothetical protein WAI453_010829 [Rhynchosporium graminicola]